MLGRAPDKIPGQDLGFYLEDGDVLLFSEQGAPAPQVLLVESVTAAQQRFLHRPLVPGENQGRVVETRPGSITLVDPASNHLTLLDKSRNNEE
ncbi:hypothetical protein SAMN00120144_0720 [Hymenobacter roseosalivarius DSM 11622]|uniref:Uncharacterized protein n=1 Tax=Hymenobacter roseosalivarius DSM 11622 TaxID=645990 RepID=A0A1W1UQZ9_9BACT|nr:hypothetical protein [Hymenobacter roseosalivarius]SMB83532.1 hypothetical protein SAMN00120144_0720 [Hymenobacter roseosalivarius DSM 11622]